MRLLKIGSSPDCDIVLNSNRVSALHAEITLLNSGDILLEDKGSTNGTFVNCVNNDPKKRLHPGVLRPIKKGDLVRFGDTDLQWSSVPHIDYSMFKKVYGIGSNLLYNDIKVTGSTVSRFHATLLIDKKGHAYIEDHSMNGTMINGKKIPSNQNIRVKHGDDVVVGGVPVDLKPYIKPDIWSTVLKVGGCAAAIAAVVAIVMKFILLDGGGNNPEIGELMNATPCVIGAYYIDVTIKDNPLNAVLPGLFPDRWRFGYDYSSGQWDLTSSNPCMYYGTAFFISEFGELGTNRHIAVPWEYLTDEQRLLIKLQMREKVNNLVGAHRKEQQTSISQNTIMRAVGYQVEEKEDDVWSVIMEELDKCDYIISGKFEYLGILLRGNTFTTSADLLACQVIAESGDANKDVALLRLNNPETPLRIAKDRKFYRIENARLDETKLQISEPLQTIGYPTGLQIGMELGNGEELNPSHANASMSRKPDNNRFQMQTVAMGGQSGSPVMDADRNLVGVLCSGYRNNEITYCCNIKHLVELYNRYKWVE